MITNEQQEKIDNMKLSDLRLTRNQLREQLEAVENELTYLHNYLKKHRPYDDETNHEYVLRMRACDTQNPTIFFYNVYQIYLEKKGTR